MLSNQEDFDRNVKRVLQETTTEEIPLDFLVDIEQRLDQLEKKKKRRILVWEKFPRKQSKRRQSLEWILSKKTNPVK